MDSRSLHSAGKPVNLTVTAKERAWLRRGLDQPDGKLPLFGPDGGQVPRALVLACLSKGLAERWFDNPLKPDWLVCRLTPAARTLLERPARRGPPLS